MHSSDEDEVPVVMLDSSDEDALPPPAKRATPPPLKKRLRKKKQRSSHKQSSPAKNSPENEQKQQQPQQVPPFFSFAGNLVGKARSIFSPPPQSATTQTTAQQIPSQPALPQSSYNSFVSAQTVPNTPGGFGDVGSYGTYFGNFSQPQLSGAAVPQQQPQAFTTAAGTPTEKADEASVPLLQKFKFSPAIFIATVSLGFLIVHQKDQIEVYLHEGIVVLFNCINYLTILTAGVGGVILLFKYVILKGLNLMKQQQQPQSNNNHNTPQQKTNEQDFAQFNPYPEFQQQQQSLPPPFADHMSPQMYLKQRPTNVSNLPRLDTTNEFGPMFHNPQGRSFSQPAIPPILNPIPTYPKPQPQYDNYAPQPQTAGGGVNGLFSSDLGPQTAPIFENKTSYFPSNFDLAPQPDDEPPQLQPSRSHQSSHSLPSPRLAIPRPSPLPRKESSSSPLSMPQNPPMSTVFSDDEEDDFEDQPPVREYSPKKRTIFTNPKRLVFRRREESENDKIEDSYVDDFSCKPYGAPPKRYHGVNV